MKAIARFDAYLRSLGIPIKGVNSGGINAEINFDASATPQQITQANNERATFNWVDGPQPDQNNLLDAIVNAVIAAQIPSQAAIYLLLIVIVADDDVRRKSLWTRIKADTNPSAGLITKIETAAANANIPLV